MRGFVLAAIAMAGLLWIAGGTSGLAAAHEMERTPAAVEQEMPATGAPIQVDSAADEDNRVSVQLWTLVAVGGAAGVGLLLLLLRIAMGWVRPPPQEEGGH